MEGTAERETGHDHHADVDLIGSAEAVLAVAALLTGLGLLLRRLWRGVKKMSHLIDNVVPRVVRAVDDVIGDENSPGMTDRLKTLESRQLSISKELHPNGGSSMRDSLTRVETALLAAKNTAERAADVAQEAADEVTSMQAALGREAAKGSSERQVLQESLNSLLSALEDFSRDTRSREIAYIRALNSMGIELKPITDELD